MSTISKECSFPDFGVPIMKEVPFWDTIVPSFIVWDILPCCHVAINEKCHLFTSGTYNVGNVSRVLRGEMPKLAGAEEMAKAKKAWELIYKLGNYSKWE